MPERAPLQSDRAEAATRTAEGASLLEVRIRRTVGHGGGNADAAGTRGGKGFSLDVQFSVGKGITVLFGPSGAGKTMILECLAGFAQPDAGRILLHDRLLFDGETKVNLPAAARRCGYVFQRPSLFPHMTLRQNLEFASSRLPRAEQLQLVRQMAERLGLADLLGRLPSQLSGGQQQRACVARALLMKPQLLLLDEPSQGLDLARRQELHHLLVEVAEEFPIPILLVTHELEEATRLADQILLLSEGRLVQSGPPSQVLAQPKDEACARLLGLFNILPAEIMHLDPSANLSRLKLLDGQVQTPYLPGHLKGDRLRVVVRPGAVIARPRSANLTVGQLAVSLATVVERPESMLLEFAEGLSAEMTKRDFSALADTRHWMLEIPADAIHVF